MDMSLLNCKISVKTLDKILDDIIEINNNRQNSEEFRFQLIAHRLHKLNEESIPTNAEINDMISHIQSDKLSIHKLSKTLRDVNKRLSQFYTDICKIYEVLDYGTK